MDQDTRDLFFGLVEAEGLLNLMETNKREIWPHRLERVEECLERTKSLGTQYQFQREILEIRYRQLRGAQVQE